MTVARMVMFEELCITMLRKVWEIVQNDFFVYVNSANGPVTDPTLNVTQC